MSSRTSARLRRVQRRSLGLGLTAAVATLLVAGHASAQLYRWVDDEGRVHFSDQPRRGSDSVEVESNRVQSVVESPRSNRAGSAVDSSPAAREVVPGSQAPGAGETDPSESTLPSALQRRLERARSATPPIATPGRQAEIDRAAEAAQARRDAQEAEALDRLRNPTAREKRDIRAERNARRNR